MDIFEFELRYNAYKGLNNKFNLNISQDEILELVKKTNKGILIKKLNETTPLELHELTLQTYTKYKIEYISKNGNININENSLKEYINRLEYELKVIKEMGYNSYFLVVADYINYAKDQNIEVGPGRGSAAGSLLSYLIGITDIDPLVYDLLFERFLNPARISMPDIDTDFEDTKREKVIEYCKNKYGNDKVALIGTYMSMAAKAAFKDVARVMGMKFEQSNSISNLITGKTILKTIEEGGEFKNLIESNSFINNIVDLAIKLEGTVRQIGVHACGVIIAPEKITKYSPIQYPQKSGTKNEKDETRIVTQYDGHFLEDIGLLKMDFLGLRNLSIIKNTIKIIKAQHENKLEEIPILFQEYYEKKGFYPPLNDNYTFEKTFQIGDTSGVFQFESDGMKNWLKKLKPNNINDIIAMVALYRPGPMEFIPSYIDRKEGKEEITYLPDEIYNEIKNKYGEQQAQEEKEKLKKDLGGFMDITYGIPIYQEQLMRIVQKMGGFSLGEADLLRRGVGKKIKEIIEQIKIEFPKKAFEYKGYKHETCIYVFEKMIEPAANYSFNKSHAACYALIAYQTAYLKAHYPIQFNAALLRSVEEDTEKLAKFIDELKINGLKILPPNINDSFNHCAAINDSIKIGFLAIKGIGYEIGKFIQQEREKNGKYNSLEDFLKRCSQIINKKSLESLIKSGALDDFEDRNTLINNQKNIFDRIKAKTEQNQMVGLFDMGNLESNLEFKNKFKTSLNEKLAMEQEVFKTFVSAHPFDGLYRYIKGKYNFISQFKDVENFGKFKIVAFVKEIRKAFGKGFFIKLEDISGTTDIFLKNILDIKEMDIFAIYGFKGKTSKIEKAVKLTIEELIEKAIKSKTYNKDENVLQIRSIRIGEKNSNVEKTIVEQKDNKEEDKEIINSEDDKDIINSEDNEIKTTNSYKFELPDDIGKIKKVCVIINENEGNIEIFINENKYKINQDGLNKLNKLLG